MPFRLVVPAALATALSITTSLHLLAQNWERDPTFAPPIFESYTATENSGFGLAPLADGRVLVAKYKHFANGQRSAALVRVNVDGSIDPGFVAAPPLTEVIHILLAYPDGRVLVTDSSRRLFRLLPNGALDPAFAVTPLDASGVNAAFTPAGRVWIWGSFRTGTTSACLALLKADGGWDERFPILDFTKIQVSDALLHSEEALTVAATSSLTRATLFRITATGALDTSFDATGTFPGADESRPEVIARQADGSIIAAGNFRAWRILPGGARNTAYRATFTDTPLGFGRAGPDSPLYYYHTQSSAIYVRRLAPDGSTDGSFLRQGDFSIMTNPGPLPATWS